VPHLDAHDSVLVVIDAQDGFYPPARTDVDHAAKNATLDRVGWVCGLACALDVPIVVTEEDAGTNGHTAPQVRKHLTDAVPVFDKRVFGAADQPDIERAVSATGRPAVVLVGMETDVCVAHTAIGFSERGRRVVVVHDAVFSAGGAHANGLARLQQEGIELLSAKELYYDWLRDLPTVLDFDAAHPELATPPGFSL
jgi:nicotinamidase-related amidase